jgi:hypothetical protein
LISKKAESIQLEPRPKVDPLRALT